MYKRIKIGDFIEFRSSKMHEEEPARYPEPGTVGTVVDILRDPKKRKVCYKVQWPTGSTSENDVWWADKAWIRKARVAPTNGTARKIDVYERRF